MVISDSEIDLNNWVKLLDESNLKADFNVFQDKILELNLRNSLFVDNTASEVIPSTYSKYLKNGVGIITCNKIANSVEYSNYELLKSLSRNNNSPFFYYGLNLNHKHLPEIKFHCALENNPIFLPSVANFYQGMIVNLFLNIKDFVKETSFFEIESFFRDYYKNQQFIKVKSNDDIQLPDGFYKPNLIVNSNDVEINIFKNTNSGQLIISANFDNLGKGASAAAIQCMNLRFGFDEILGL